MLDKIFKKYGITLKNTDGSIRNTIDVLEDMYLKLTPAEFNKIMYEVSEEERYSNIFDDERGRKYRGVE